MVEAIMQATVTHSAQPETELNSPGLSREPAPKDSELEL